MQVWNSASAYLSFLNLFIHRQEGNGCCSIALRYTCGCGPRHHINSKSAVLVDGNISDPFEVSTGVLQGDVSAPFLFIILVGNLMRKATSNLDSRVETISSQGIEWPRFLRRHCPLRIHNGPGTGSADQYSISSKRSWPYHLCFQRQSTWLQIVTPSLHFKSMVTPSTLTMLLTDFKIAASDLNRRKALAWVLFGNWKDCGKVPNYPSLRKWSYSTPPVWQFSSMAVDPGFLSLVC